MQFFVDSADITQIRLISELGLLDGVTTNPSLILKSGRKIYEVISEICALVTGPVSVEVVASDCNQMLIEASKLLKIAPNICIKLPLTFEGLKACKKLSSQNIQTNMTLCFAANQALLAAKAGATFVSPFIGRLDDVGQNGLDLISEIRTIYDNYGFKTQILAASIRSVNHVQECALRGADVATTPPVIIYELINHPLTTKGLEIFNNDWAKTGQKI